MGCINTKLSKKRRRERKRLGLQEVKQFLKAEKDKHTKLAAKTTPVQRSPSEWVVPVTRKISNTTYTIEMSSSSDEFESPAENHYIETKDSNTDYVSDHDSVSYSSCSIHSLENTDAIQNGFKPKQQTSQNFAGKTGNNNELDKSDVIRRPDAPYGFRTETATVNKSPPPYLLPGFIDELDKDLERVISDEKPKQTIFFNLEENKNILARPKAAKGVRTPHCINSSTVMKTSTMFSLPGCVDELNDEIDNLIDGNSVLLSKTRSQGYMSHPKPIKRDQTSFTNIGNNQTVITRTKTDIKQLNDEIESLINGNSKSPCGLGLTRPKAAKGKRTLHTTFTDNDNDNSYNLPGTVMPSTSQQLSNRNASLPSFSPQRSQLTVKEVISHQSKFSDNWMEKRLK